MRSGCAALDNPEVARLGRPTNVVLAKSVNTNTNTNTNTICSDISSQLGWFIYNRWCTYNLQLTRDSS